jgi:hypothetical protein
VANMFSWCWIHDTSFNGFTICIACISSQPSDALGAAVLNDVQIYLYFVFREPNIWILWLLNQLSKYSCHFHCIRTIWNMAVLPQNLCMLTSCCISEMFTKISALVLPMCILLDPVARCLLFEIFSASVVKIHN